MPRRWSEKKRHLGFAGLALLGILVCALFAVIIWLEVHKSSSVAPSESTGPIEPIGPSGPVGPGAPPVAGNIGPSGTIGPSGPSGQTSQARECDAGLEAIPESERVTKLGTKQCAVVYPEKYGRVYLRVEGTRYLGVVDGKLRVVGAESAAVFKFKKVTEKTFVVTTTKTKTLVVVEPRTSSEPFYAREDQGTSPPTLVVTGVPKRDVIAVHHARVDESGAVVRSETDAVVVEMIKMDGTSAYGIYVPADVSALLEESMARAAKVRAMRASCCSRFGQTCVDPKDTVLKPMCCTECKDTLETCPELVRYDAWPLIQRDTCCQSIAMLGITRVYGDSECAAVPGTCDRDAQIEYTRLSGLTGLTGLTGLNGLDGLTGLDVGVYVPSFGEVAVARFLCNELYTT